MPSSLVIRMRTGAASSFRDSLNAAHVGPECLRHDDRTIALLVIFKDRDERAACGNARTVQRVNKTRVSCFFRAVARVHPPRLKIAAKRAGRDFAIAVLSRQPDLDVIGFLCSK